MTALAKQQVPGQHLWDGGQVEVHDGQSVDEAVVVDQQALQQTTMQVLRQGSLINAAALCDQQQQHHKPANAQIRQMMHSRQAAAVYASHNITLTTH